MTSVRRAQRGDRTNENEGRRRRTKTITCHCHHHFFLGLKDHDSKRILELVALIGKLFGRSKDGPLEIKASPGFASEKLFRRSVKRILTKYKETIRKLEK
jgi:hypothetical protein